jgi:hypothetical protein
MDVGRSRSWLRYSAMAGNVLYLLWIARNAVNEGFRAGPVEAVSLGGLIVLLILNVVLLSRREA